MSRPIWLLIRHSLSSFGVRDEDPARVDAQGSPEEAATYVAFVLMASGQLSLTELGTARAIDELVADIQSSICVGGNPALVAELLTELHAKIWAPLEGFLGASGKSSLARTANSIAFRLRH